MLSSIRWLKIGYFAALASALVVLLSKPEPVRAQRTLAYAFLPGEMSGVLSRGILSGFGAPMASFAAAQMMLMEAGIPASVTMGGGLGMAGAAGMNGGVGMNGMGMGGGMMGMGGNMMGMGGGMMGMGGNMMGMGGMGGMMGMGGMGGMRGGMGGMGGFAGKGFGGFNGKKPL